MCCGRPDPVAPSSGRPSRLTISVGVAEWSTGEPFERVAGRADARLYRAKESGRNRVVAA